MENMENKDGEELIEDGLETEGKFFEDEDGEYEEEEEEEEEGRRRRIGSVMDEEIESLVCENGWIVRRLVEKDEEIRNAANVQAEAFHVPVSLFNPLFFQFFQVQYCFSLFST